MPANGPATVRELIAKAKANPGKLNYGAGIITTRLAGYLFSRFAGMDTVFIPYKGSAEVVQGLLTGSVDFSIDDVSASLPLIMDGKLRAACQNSITGHCQCCLMSGRSQRLRTCQSSAKSQAGPGSWRLQAHTPAVIDRVQRDVAQVAADRRFQPSCRVSASSRSAPRLQSSIGITARNRSVSKVFKDSGITLE